MLSDSPKTLHVTNAFHGSSGGIATYYRELIKAANRFGRPVRLVVPSHDTSIEEAGAWGRIYRIKAPLSPFFDRRYRIIWPHQFAVPCRSALRRILELEQPDIVEVCEKYTLCFLPSVLRKRWIPGLRVPTIVGMSAERVDDNVAAFLTSSDLGRRFANWYVRTVYVPRFDYPIANSEYTADELRNHGPARYRDRIAVCPLGADIEIFEQIRRCPDSGGITTYLNLSNGWPVPANGADFARAVLSVVQHENARREKVARAQKTARAFRWDSSMQRLFDTYDYVVLILERDERRLHGH